MAFTINDMGKTTKHNHKTEKKKLCTYIFLWDNDIKGPEERKSSEREMSSQTGKETGGPDH